MYLKRLEIQGFKTFAAPIVFEFRPGITAIVGPNGSGKSNVADAVRWVLGEQSYAALRSKRTEDLIFGGGGRRAPAGLAEVSLTIDNSDRLLALPYGEVTITRRATRAGDNEYFINRSRVRLRDIQEAIGPLGGSYTIINQGMVDAALTLRPDERRRLFEDAAEISVFESRKSEAERRLRETAANVERCSDMLAELEPRLRSLKRQAGLARTYRDLLGELRALLTQHYVALWHAGRRALAAAEASEQALAAALQARRALQAAATVELREARERLRALRERLGSLHAESSALHTRAEAIQRDLAVGNERLASLGRRGEELARELRELDLRREEFEHERATVSARMAAAEARLADYRRAVAELEGEIAGQEQVRRAAQRSLDAAQRSLLEAGAALAERRRRTEQFARQRERLAREQADHTAALAAAAAALTTQREAQASAQARLAQAEQARAALTAASEQARAELEAARANRAHAEESIAAARRSFTDVEARLEALNRLQRSYTGVFAGVKAAMQWAEAQGRSGFALVASLVRAPAAIETAIEVALGARLQHIVVERWGDAEDAIEALRRGGVGRATFLPLDTIRPPSADRRGPGEARRPPQAHEEDGLNGASAVRQLSVAASNEVLGVAAELVEHDEHYAAVVQMLLGRTLIVRDLPIARRELRRMQGGWSIVTLAGEQVSSGGAVTGGAQMKESGVLRRERELRELPAQVAARRAELDAALRAREEIEARVAAAERALREADAALRRATQEREGLSEAHERARRAAERAEADLTWQRRRHEQAAAALNDQDEQEAALRDEIADIEARESEARARHERLRADEQARSAAEAESQRQIATLRAALATAEGEARAERAVLQSHGQALARIAEQHDAGLRRVEELGGERATLDVRLQELDAAHTALLAEIDARRALIGPAEAELVALEQAQADIERREAELTAALLEGESAHSRAAVEVQRARDHIETLQERAAADEIDIRADALVPAGEQEEAGAGKAVADEIERLRERIRRLGAVNPFALEEYEETSERHTFLTTQLDDLRRAAASLHELIAELDEAMQSRFQTTFRAVAAEFEHSFTRLFGGGHAQLILTYPKGNDAAPANGAEHNGVEHNGVGGMGVDILARPPGKRQQTLALLSGGERSLTASALLFAILKVNPAPFCILDEVDAALDETNVGRFREALADLAEQTQFLIVTHNRGTIEGADTIYGISMGDDGASRVLSLRLEELV